MSKAFAIPSLVEVSSVRLSPSLIFKFLESSADIATTSFLLLEVGNETTPFSFFLPSIFVFDSASFTFCSTSASIVLSFLHGRLRFLCVSR